MAGRTVAYALFETPWGSGGVAWTDAGLVGVELPEATAAATRARLVARHPNAREAAPPAAVRRAQRLLAAQLGGKRVELGSVALDLGGVTDFRRRVYEELRKVRRGTTVTYSELARRVGSPGAARAVGSAMAENPLPLAVPCHRVLAAAGRLGGFSAFGGGGTKAALLAQEGVRLPGATLGLDYEPHAAARALARKDERLARVIRRAGPMRLAADPVASTFEALGRAIIYQQLHGAAAATIAGRVAERLGGGAFPAPEAVSGAADEELRSCGLSRAKTAALKDLAARSLDGRVPNVRALRRLSDAEIVERLTAVRGVGRWTVEMLLIFRLGRADVLPADDYGVRCGYSAMAGTDGLPTPRELEAYGERWRPFRSVAAWYLWRAAEARKRPRGA